MRKKLRQIREEAATVNAGGGNVAGLGIDAPGKPGSGEPGVNKKKKSIIGMLRRKLGEHNDHS